MRSPVPLILVFLSAAASSQAQAPETFEGKIIARIVFDPAAQPLPIDELERRVLPLKAGFPLQIKDVRTAIQELYNTGRYSDVSVDAEPEDAGVSLKITTELSYFVGRVTIVGAAEPPNREQIVAATKLQLGGPFDDSQMVQAVKNIQDRLRANGFYKSEVSYRVDRNPATEEAGLFFEIHTGSRARFDGVNLSGTFSRPPESVIRATGWRRGLGPLILPGWRELTAARVQNALSRVEESFQKGDHLEARVTLGPLDIHDGPKGEPMNRVTPSLHIESGPIIDVIVTGATVSKGRLRRLIPVYEERAVDRGLLLEGRANLLDYFQSQGYLDAQIGDPEQREPEAGRSVIEYRVTLGPRHKLVNIDIAGNRYFDTPTLRERLSMTPASSIRHSRGSFSQGLLDRDIGTIEDLYHANGFPDAKVVSTKADNYKGKTGDLSVRLEVMEGAQKFVNKLTLEGVPDEDASHLRSLLQSTEGQPFSEPTIASDRDSILSYYFNSGYSDATFDWTQTPGPTAQSSGSEIRRPARQAAIHKKRSGAWLGHRPPRAGGQPDSARTRATPSRKARSPRASKSSTT